MSAYNNALRGYVSIQTARNRVVIEDQGETMGWQPLGAVDTLRYFDYSQTFKARLKSDK